MLKASVKKTRYGFRGFIRCVEGNRTRWTEWTGIERLSREDALWDALLRKADREATWKDYNETKTQHPAFH